MCQHMSQYRVKNSVLNTSVCAVASYQAQWKLNGPVYLFVTFRMLFGNVRHRNCSLFLKFIVTENA